MTTCQNNIKKPVEWDTDTFSYAASVAFVVIGVSYLILLVTTLISVLVLPGALVLSPIIALLFFFALLASSTFSQTFFQVFAGFIDKVKAVPVGELTSWREKSARDHVSVPPHTIATDEEVRAFLALERTSKNPE